MDMRVLLAARLSRAKSNEGDDRTDRDEDALKRWAMAHDHEVIAVTKDVGVSGAVAPTDRPKLGPWLTDEALRSRWDAIVVTDVDRIGRDARAAINFRAWCEGHAKKLIVTKRTMEWPSEDPFAGLQWGILELLAEMERTSAKDKVRGARETTAERGGFIGKPPWAYELTGDRYERKLQPVGRLVDVQREMVARALAGDSYSAIGYWLDEQKIEPAQGGRWSAASVSNALHQPALKGQIVGAGGKVVHRFASILTATEWKRLQIVLGARPKRRGAVTNGSPLLLGSIECGLCGGRMQRWNCGTKAKPRYVYRCNRADGKKDLQGCRNQVRLDDADEWVGLWFTGFGPWANTELVTQTIVPGDDHSAEVADIKTQIALLDPEDADYDDNLSALRSELSRVKALPIEEPSIEETPTGQTVGELWSSLTTNRRRDYLIAGGVRIVVSPLEEAVGNFSTGRHNISMTGNPHKVSSAVRLIAG
jgi:DNA invertase Pin-like site-specific DNA recombinase